MRNATGIVIAAALVSVLGFGAWTMNGNEDPDNPFPASGPVMGHGDDRYPSSSANEWVSNADHVVVATPLSEAEIAPGTTEVDRGEGLIGRNVTMRVDKLLWSSPQPAAPAPQTYSRQSSGWVFQDTVDNRREFALHDRPRIEPGHSYIIALHWEPARCSEGDEPEPAQWVGLGAGSNLPFDDGVIGKGEFEGEVQPAPAPALGLTGAEVLDDPVAEVLAGQGQSALVNLLSQAIPESPTTQASRPGIAATC
ncbi:hypothetical protein PV664_34320 [Streptomyces sp. ME01-18a]|uniref:hypothetical protein n=1 Tax=Streptomyces sp. ME01-18a TaxID=3028669 RepID=UPI0029AD0C6C|nr:hypothetical protein [Streptomyces sp. ME01-18a]MDX3433950.1 hypothetical protein [Streptomyces sp. ME01-18a]